MRPPTLARRRYRLDSQPIVAGDDLMHHRFGDSTMLGNLLGFPGLDLGIVDDEPSLSAPGAWVCLEPMLDFFNREMGDCSRHSCHIVPPSRWKFSPPLFYHGMRIGIRPSQNRQVGGWRGQRAAEP